VVTGKLEKPLPVQGAFKNLANTFVAGSVGTAGEQQVELSTGDKCSRLALLRLGWRDCRRWRGRGHTGGWLVFSKLAAPLCRRKFYDRHYNTVVFAGYSCKRTNG
jgi:hypothetical protein